MQVSVVDARVRVCTKKGTSEATKTLLYCKITTHTVKGWGSGR